MRITTLFMIALLSIGILSYGSPSSTAQECDLDAGFVAVAGECVPALDDKISKKVPVTIDQTAYKDKDTIKLSGNVTPGDVAYAVTIRIVNPDNNIAYVAQLTPTSNGTFEDTIQASGTYWKMAGIYKIVVQYGTDKSEINFSFEGSADAVAPPPKPTPEPVPEPEPEPVAPEPEPVPVEPVPVEPQCGPGTEPDENGICQVITPEPDPEPVAPVTPTDTDNGCLIATAAYGSELAPQVQMLREVRDGTLYSTASGTSFMTSFNQLYYAFSPTIADWERQNSVFKDVVKTAITPMLSSLSIMTLAEQGSEAEVLGYGISVIALNLGMYIIAPVGAIFVIRRHFKSAN